jgi:hypothetical protein
LYGKEERDWVKEDVCQDRRRKLEMEKNRFSQSHNFPAHSTSFLLLLAKYWSPQKGRSTDPRLPAIHQMAALEKKAFQPHPVRIS